MEYLEKLILSCKKDIVAIENNKDLSLYTRASLITNLSFTLDYIEQFKQSEIDWIEKVQYDCL